MLIVFGAMGLALVESILEEDYPTTGTITLIIILIAVLFHYTRYKLEGNQLSVYWIKIDIQSIRKVYKTNNPISSPALSLDRIEIIYNKFDSILISPKDKKSFVEDLLKINPNIDVRI